MKISKILTLVLAGTLLFNISCRNDDPIPAPTPKGAYENGILIANEGNYGTPNSTVSFISNDLNTVENNIYSTNNSNAQLGDVLQNIGLNGNNAYLVLNNSNKIEVVNRYTFKKVATVSDQISQPRYIAFASNNYYVTNSSGSSKYVSVYSTANNAFVKKIEVSGDAEKIVEAGGNIFVQNASFGFGNKITVINPTSNTVTSTLTIPNGDIKKTISNGGNVYVISSTSTNSYIYKISPSGTISSTITLTGLANGCNLAIDGNRFYFTTGIKVFSMDMNSTTVPTTPIITVVDSGYSTLYGFDVIDGKIFVSDAKGFTQDSEVKVYSATGTLLKTITTGRLSNGFYKN